MNFSGSIALSVLFHGAIAVAVITAPPVVEEPVRALDVYVQERVVEFEPAGVIPHQVHLVPTARADQGSPDEARPEEPEEQEPVDEEPVEEEVAEPVEDRDPAPPKDPVESRDDPVPPEEPPEQPAQPVEKPVIASPEADSPVEIRQVADASGPIAKTSALALASTSRSTSRRPNAGNRGTRQGTSRGEGRGSEGVDRKALLRAWLKSIFVEVQKAQRYPRAARRARQQGKVAMRVWIDAAGNVKRVELADSSGHSTLDRAALQLIESISPVPAPPKALRWTTRPINLPVTYRLH